MSRSFRLTPGEWTTVTASMKDQSTDWWKARINNDFRSDIRKISIRVESRKYSYSGPIYIDNIQGFPFTQDEKEKTILPPPEETNFSGDSAHFMDEEAWY